MFTNSLAHIVEHNFLNAYILDSFGIEFFKYPNASLEDVCKRMRLSPAKIIEQLHKPYLPENVIKNAQLSEYSVTELVRLLKSTHRQFVRRQLPFMNKLVHSVPVRELSSHYREVLEILQLGFHLFAEDFVHHILDEEKKVFDYLVSLEYARYDKNHLHACFFRIKKTSLSAMSCEHADDDEMRSIREMTEDYALKNDMPLVIKVLYEEFRRFDADLQRHAEIENNYLFPKGQILEKSVIGDIQKISILN